MDIIESYKKQYQGIFNGAVNEEAVEEILNQYGVINLIYRNWLIQTGGGPMGPDWLDGIEELKESQKKFKNEPWSVSGFVIGWDGVGNPLVLSKNGEIITEDHNFGGAHKVASSFEELLAKHVNS